MDNSFLKLHNTLTDALSVGDMKNASLIYWTSIILSPNEEYLQLTDVTGGISLGSSYLVKIIDGCGNVLEDITNNVYISDFLDADGVNQHAIEIINLPTDYFGRAVLLKFDNNTTPSKIFYTSPVKVTDHDSFKTISID